MSDQSPATPANPAPTQALAIEYLRTWTESLSFVLGQITGKPFPMAHAAGSPPECPATAETDHCLIVTSGGSLRGEMGLRVPRQTVIEVAQIFVGEPSDGAVEFKPDHQEAFEELLRQAAGHVVTSIKAAWGEAPIQVASAAVPPSWSVAATEWLFALPEVPCRLWIECQISAALQASLATAARAAEEAALPVTVGSEAQHPAENVPVPGNLDLLMDVELGVTLRFGSRNMLLRDILELGAGAVVELDRRVEEPAELLLDGRLIARGEIVVVDGNYGLRVLDVVTPRIEQGLSQGSGR